MLDIDGKQHDDGRRRGGHAAEVGRLPFGSVIVERHVEARQAQGGREREDHHAYPAEALQVAEPPGEDQECRRHAEVDEIGEAVELGAEARRRLEQARNAAVDAVEHCGEHDRRQRQLVAPLDGHADGGQAGA